MGPFQIATDTLFTHTTSRSPRNTSGVGARGSGKDGLALNNVIAQDVGMNKFLVLMALLCVAACLGVHANIVSQAEPLDGPIGLYYDPGRIGTVGIARVIDARTGRGLRSAYVECCAAGEGREAFIANECRADAHGFIRVPNLQPSPRWFVFQCDGYGPVSMDFVPDIVHLMPGVDVPVEVSDMFGRPIPGAAVGLCLGGGSPPPVRRCVTNDEGRAVVSCVEPTGAVCRDDSGVRDFYVLAPGLSGDYHEEVWQDGDLPISLRQRLVPTVAGRFRGPNGTPVPGIAVGSQWNRGPWVWSNESGFFIHSGRHAWGETVIVKAFDRQYELQPSELGATMDVVLPKSSQEERGRGGVRVVVRDASTLTAVTGAVIKAWCTGIVGPGKEMCTAATDSAGASILNVPEGQVELRISDDADVPSFDSQVVSVHVSSAAVSEVLVEVRSRAERMVVVEGAWDDVRLLTATENVLVSELIRCNRMVPLPCDSPFALLVTSRRGERAFQFLATPSTDVHIAAFESTRVQIRVVGADGKAALSNITIASEPDVAIDNEEVCQTDVSGAGVVWTSLEGSAFVRVQPLDSAWRSSTVRIALPKAGAGARCDMGIVTLRMTGDPQLMVLDKDGGAANGWLRVLRPGVVAKFCLAPDGGYDGMSLASGDLLQWTSSQNERCSTTWCGQSAWTVLGGSSTLHVDVVDEFGIAPKNAVVVFGDRVWRDPGSSVTIHDVETGQSELFVGADGCRGVRVPLIVSEGLQRVSVVVSRLSR